MSLTSNELCAASSEHFIQEDSRDENTCALSPYLVLHGTVPVVRDSLRAISQLH